MKNIAIKDDTGKKLSKFKIDGAFPNFDIVINFLLTDYEINKED